MGEKPAQCEGVRAPWLWPVPLHVIWVQCGLIFQKVPETLFVVVKIAQFLNSITNLMIFKKYSVPNKT